MKLTVTCTCGHEVSVPKSVAAIVLAADRRKRDIDELKNAGRKGAAKRWHGHIKKVNK